MYAMLRRGGGKEGVEVGCGLGGKGFGSGAAEAGEEFGSENDVGGLVGLAAEWDGREERGVGFDKDAIGGCGGSDGLDGGGFGVGEVAGEAEGEAEVERGF